jgi:hypothetical protein
MARSPQIFWRFIRSLNAFREVGMTDDTAKGQPVQFEIRNRQTRAVQVIAEINCAENAPLGIKLGMAVEWAHQRHADLRGADLHDALLYDTDMRGADLSDTDLRCAEVCYAGLSGANLSRADLSRADLGGANLSGANLSDANLSGADLHGVNLSGADISGADISGADLRYANLSDAKGAELAIARTRILPTEGEVIGWKKCRDDVLIKLRIPHYAGRSHALGRKCRAQYAHVLAAIGADVGISIYDGSTEYRPGECVTADGWEPDWTHECAGGIHFYLTREEAEAHV